MATTKTIKISRSMQDLHLRSAESADRDFAQAIAEKCFGIQASASELPSERDRNFLLTAHDGNKFVLKIANALEQHEVLEAQNAMLSHLERHVSFCPRVVPAISGEEIASVTLPDDSTHLVRVVRYLPGVPLATVKTHSPELLFDLGRKLGQLNRALVGFDHPAAHREFHWDLAKGVQILERFGPRINTDWLREMVLSFRENLCLSVALRQSVIHADANDYNVLVDGNRVVGIIDFGDVVYSYTVGDLAIAIAYVVLGKADPFAAAEPVIDGYREEFPLTRDELDTLWPLVRLRLCMSVCLAAHQQQQQPDNEYLGVSQKLIAQTLPRLMSR
jgi:Ser/Thr protein kinase RdoA (MazF antagonist)